MRGVESIGAGGDPAELAREAARTLGVVASVTGPVDHVSDGERVAAVANGHELLATVTGTGCMSTAITGCFLAGEGRPARGGREALAAFGVAGEDAAAGRGPGTFHVALYDALAALDAGDTLASGRGSRGGCTRSSRTRRRRAARCAGGATVVQLRLKGASTSGGRRARAGARATSTPTLFVNDDVDAALELGRRRPPRPGRRRRRARARGGHPARDLGADAARGDRGGVRGATYLGAGPIWETPSKPDADPPIGLDGLRDVCLAVSIPVVAIGGIDASNAAACIRAGAAGSR